MVCDATALMALGLGGAELAKRVGWEYGTATAVGSAIGDAVALTKKVSVVAGADGSVGCQIPTVGIGEVIIVKNSANAVLKVYPTSASDAFNAGTGGAAVSIAAYTAALIVRISATDNIAIEISAA